MANLGALPDAPVKEICNHAGVQEILTLRKVSVKLRTQVDKWNPDLKIDHLFIILKISSIEMKMISGEKQWIFLYDTDLDGCYVINEGRKNFVKDEHYMKVFLKDLEIMFRNRKSVLQTLSLKIEDPEKKIRQKKVSTELYDIPHALFRRPRPDSFLKLNPQLVANYYKFLAALKNILKSDPRMFQVDTLHLHVLDHRQIMQVLPHVNPEKIKSLEIYNPEGHNNQLLRMNEVLELKQFKNLQRIIVKDFYLRDALQNYSHLLKANFCVQTVTAEDIVLLKNAFAKDPNFDMFFMEYKKFEGKKRLERLFNGFELDQFSVDTCIYKIPTQHYREKEFVIVITFVTNLEIRFKRLSLAKLREVVKEDDIYWIN
ncbi:unnamed protein product [Caenorhabditis brenneri]